MNIFKRIKYWILKCCFKGECYYINGSEVLKPPLSAEEEAYWLTSYQSDHNIIARDQLIEHNMRLVIYVAKRYDTDITNLEDLVSIGTMGLIKAIKTFNGEKKIKLATYASRCIENEILMHLRKNSKRRYEISLDEPLNRDSEGNELLLQDIIPTSEISVVETLDDNKMKADLIEAIKDLNEREQEIISMRFGLFDRQELTQKETADLLGISQSYISRLEKRIIQKLRLSLVK